MTLLWISLFSTRADNRYFNSTGRTFLFRVSSLPVDIQTKQKIRFNFFLVHADVRLCSFLIPRSLFFVPYSSFLVPRSSFLVPRSSFLVPYSSFLVPRSSFLVPYSSFLIPHSSFLVPYSSFLVP